MLDILLWILLGAFIGWNMPQPPWAKLVQAKIVSLYREKFGKKE
jgi:hypothetical protein